MAKRDNAQEEAVAEVVRTLDVTDHIWDVTCKIGRFLRQYLLPILYGMVRLLINSSRLIRRRISLIMRRRSWKRFKLWVKAIRNFITDLGITAIVIGIISLVVWESFREVIVIGH